MNRATLRAALAAIAVLMVSIPLRLGAQELPRVHDIEIGGGVVTVRFIDTPKIAAQRGILSWVQKSAEAVTVYYGRFPVDTVDIYVSTFPGRGVRGGRAYGGRSPRISIKAGTRSTPHDFAVDWRMVHEMIHMAFPMLDQRHGWMSEGLAVYVESVARLQADHLDEATVWKGFVDGMQQGLPSAGDRGLDNTSSWGRTYWGGAIFCLVADLEIRKRTKGRKTLQDALRGIIATGGNQTEFWPLEKALKAGDAATRTSVLMDLYEDWRAKPVDPDLPDLWKRLGIEDRGRTVSFDDTADLAAMRKQIGKRANR